MFNFAHGALLMVGAFVAWWLSDASGLGLPLSLAILGSMGFMIVGGAAVYALLVRPWLGRNNAELAVIMTTIAAAMFLENLALMLFGGRLKAIDQVVTGTVAIGGTAMQAQNLLVILLAPALLGAFAVFLKLSKHGLAIRAIAENREAARLLGIRIELVYVLTFAVSAVLAGIAGIMIGGLFNISPSMGTDPLLRAFLVVVLGGLGSLPGTILAAYLIGLIEAMSSYYIGIYWTPVVLFSVLIAILLVRPGGLMGSRGMRRVFRSRAEAASWLAALAALIVLPMLMSSGVTQNLAILALLFAVVASNWDLTLGYAGIFNFAHVAFFGLAAYVAAISTIHLGVPIWLDIALAVVVVALLAGVTAALALQLRGIYVALVTFAFVQLCVALILSQRHITGGAVGLVGVPDLEAFGITFGIDPRSYVYLAGAVLMLSTLFLRWLVRSDFGLSLVALRDNESYAVSRGIPSARQRTFAMVASSIFTSVAGAIYAHYLIVASPDIFSFSLTTLILSMTLLGGTGTIYGPILAAMVLTVMTEQLARFGVVRFLIIAILIVLTLRFLPGGLWSIGQARSIRPRARARAADPSGDQG